MFKKLLQNHPTNMTMNKGSAPHHIPPWLLVVSSERHMSVPTLSSVTPCAQSPGTDTPRAFTEL